MKTLGDVLFFKKNVTVKFLDSFGYENSFTFPKETSWKMHRMLPENETTKQPTSIVMRKITEYDPQSKDFCSIPASALIESMFAHRFAIGINYPPKTQRILKGKNRRYRRSRKRPVKLRDHLSLID